MKRVIIILMSVLASFMSVCSHAVASDTDQILNLQSRLIEAQNALLSCQSQSAVSKNLGACSVRAEEVSGGTNAYVISDSDGNQIAATKEPGYLTLTTVKFDGLAACQTLVGLRCGYCQ